MLEVMVTHKCGCEWKIVFVRKASRHELKMLHAAAAETVCLKCERKSETERVNSDRKNGEKVKSKRCPWSKEIENPCTNCGECMGSKLVEVDYQKEMLEKENIINENH